MTALALAPAPVFPPPAPAAVLAPAIFACGLNGMDAGHTTAADHSALIAAVAAARDRAAFAALFAHFAPRVKTFMLRAGANAAQAEELAQETLLTVWRKADRFDPARATAAAWIFTVARNLRIDRLRREWRDTAGDGEIPEIADETEAPDIRLSGDQRDARVRAAMTRLSAEQARVIELSFFQDMPHAEIARALGLPLGTVKSRIRLAMTRLRDLLEDLA
jgi:RNA polymerase sigma-70 factor (ECF subfamily)